jgi:hypothetical protein
LLDRAPTLCAQYVYDAHAAIVSGNRLPRFRSEAGVAEQGQASIEHSAVRRSHFRLARST